MLDVDKQTEWDGYADHERQQDNNFDDDIETTFLIVKHNNR